MAPKLTILVATFIALLFLADASIHRTTVIIDDENPSQQGCSEQVRKQQNLNRCRDFLTERATKEGSRGRGGYYNQQEDLRACCNQLQGLESQCMCQGLKMAMQQRQMPSQAYRMAQDLPSMCGLKQSRCDEFGSQEIF
ncbi:2S seed storage albumin protein-like [Mercurialis annua]|uniref:2S seed storage albumin protein-like n=1 Tax=Mercurialis annua TaxID=3986 RepID=UPI00215FDD16|nr:2S seed storage albumin protein-like [Mercurialis annua]